MYGQRIEEGQYSQFYLPFSEYKIIWSITHLKTLLCNNTLRLILPKAFLSGRIPSELHWVFCPRVHICHTSKAAPVAEYFTQLSAEQLRLFLASEGERPFVQINSQ